MMIELVRHPRLKVVNQLWLLLLKAYFRIEVKGLENIPKTGGALICPNHSGFAGADAVLLTWLIRRYKRRRARILAHRAFFDFSQTLKTLSESYGLRKASVETGTEILKRDQLLLLFPEGETGNFKPTLKRYHLQKFHSGFLRMAIQAGKPIVPCLVIGAEESHLNLGNLDFSKFVKGLKIPLPLNFVPLPAKWQIHFLSPIDPTALDPAILDSPRKLAATSLRIQRQMQREILLKLRERPFIYFQKTRNLKNAVERKVDRAKRKARVVARKALQG